MTGEKREAKATVRRGARGIWQMNVTDSNGVIVWADNGSARAWPKLVEEGRQMVGFVRRAESMGQALRPWAVLVDEAGASL